MTRVVNSEEMQDAILEILRSLLRWLNLKLLNFYLRCAPVDNKNMTCIIYYSLLN